jgi:predicted nuclease of predicted toxin-antitoxin system
MLAASDGAIWEYAVAHDAIIVTKDEDFSLMSASAREPTPRIIWIRVGNCSKRELLVWFEPRFVDILAALESGDRLVELR